MANKNIKICTLNCAGLREKSKLFSILKVLKDKKADVAMLQETHLVKSDLNFIENIWKGTVHLTGTYTNNKGLITLFSKKY